MLSKIDHVALAVLVAPACFLFPIVIAWLTA